MNGPIQLAVKGTIQSLMSSV